MHIFQLFFPLNDISTVKWTLRDGTRREPNGDDDAKELCRFNWLDTTIIFVSVTNFAISKSKVVIYSIRMTKDICVNEVTVHVQKREVLPNVSH